MIPKQNIIAAGGSAAISYDAKLAVQGISLLGETIANCCIVVDSSEPEAPGEPILAPSATWYKGNLDRAKITKVTFAKSVDTSLPEYSPPVYESVLKSFNSHTSNLTSKDSTKTGYGNSKNITDKVTIPGAVRLSIEITYQTQGANYDWVCIYDASTKPSLLNYNSSVSGKLAGATKATKTFTVDGDTCQIYFRSNITNDGYYGYWADITGYDSDGNEVQVYEQKQVGGATDTWDASAAQDKSVTGYIINDTEVVVAGNGAGKIIGNTNSSSMFSNFAALTSVDFNCFDSKQIQNASKMFFKCKNLETLDLSSFYTGSVTDMNYLFGDCAKLVTLDLSGWDTSMVTNMAGMFFSCNALEKVGDLSTWNTSSVTDMSEMFYTCRLLTGLDLSKWNTSKVKNMTRMFFQCELLTGVNNLSNWDTSQVENMNVMFSGSALTSTHSLSIWDTSSVTDMSEMFSGTAITSIDGLLNWNTSQVKNMHNMFYECNQLSSINLSNCSWDTSKVTDMSRMFEDCDNVKTINLSCFNTNSVTDMSYLFINCVNLVTLDLSSWDTSMVTDMMSMFAGCTSLKTIYASDLFTCDRLTGSTADKNMFYNCNSLVGGNGTKYADKLTQDKTMACIDKVNQPGYFTYKAAPNALSDETTNLPAEVGKADISVIDNETIELPAQPECIQDSTTLESDPNPDNQELINTLSSEDSQETGCAQERQPDEVVDQQLPAA